MTLLSVTAGQFRERTKKWVEENISKLYVFTSPVLLKLFKALQEVTSEPTVLILQKTRGTSTLDWQSPPACSRILSLHQASAWSTLWFAVFLPRTSGKGEERRSHLNEELTCAWDLWIQGPSGVCWCRSTHGERDSPWGPSVSWERNMEIKFSTPTDPGVFILRFLIQIAFTLWRFLLGAGECGPGPSLQKFSRVIRN